jgi:DNA-binding NarL/FixJ family response regulator
MALRREPFGPRGDAMTCLDVPMNVVLATDSLLFGDGLQALLASVPDVEVVGRAHDLEQLHCLVSELDPEAVIVSLRTPVISTMETIIAARRLRAEFPALIFVLISDVDNGFALELLRGGAAGIAFLVDEKLLSLESVVAALRSLRAKQSVLDPSIVECLLDRNDDAGIISLTLREIDALEQIAHGLSNRAVAAELHVSIKAVEKYVTIIFRKLGLVDSSAMDRRVTASLMFLRAQANPFTPNLSRDVRATRWDPSELESYVRSHTKHSV